MADVRARSVYYYIVNLEHPTRKRSLEEATIVRKEVFPDGKGTFKYVWGDVTKNVSVARAAIEYSNTVKVSADEAIKKARLSILTQTLVLPEVAHNYIIQEKLTEKLEAFGFEVVGNKGTITSSHPVRLSRYYKSRPDIVIYHSKKLLAAIINSGESDAEADPSTLVGAITENIYIKS